MTLQNFSTRTNLAADIPSSVVVFLVALPLCLGIALASGAPLIAGLISGIVGGIVVGAISKSPLSVSGPAAGLTVIVLTSIQKLPSYEAFLLAVALAGMFQVLFAVCRAGVVGDFIPSSVIKGMLAAIGVILILKQIPHAIGYDAHFIGEESFGNISGENTFNAIWMAIQNYILPGAFLVSAPALLFLFWWDKKQPTLKGFFRYLPGPLLVVFWGVALNMFLNAYLPSLAIGSAHLVAVPVMGSLTEFTGTLRFPDFSAITNPTVWTVAITIALVASIETLLSIEAVDKLDPFKRITPTNRELLAQGIGNIACASVGGLPVTSVIVRSSANVSAGGRTKMSAILHGFLLLISLLTIPALLNKIPLAALAAILLSLGYKLTKPQIFRAKYEMGMSYFIPFVTTVIAIVITDLLVGIAIGIAVGAVFVLRQNFVSALSYRVEGDEHQLQLNKDFFFLHKYELKRTFAGIPDGAKVTMDLTKAQFVDRDNIEIINDFITNAQYRNIRITVNCNPGSLEATFIKVPA
jgi:MFS superfamily sulfate permease-like transporter